LLPLLVAVLALTAACGGGEDGPATPSSPAGSIASTATGSAATPPPGWITPTTDPPSTPPPAPGSSAGAGGTGATASTSQGSPAMLIHFAAEGGFAGQARSITVVDGGSAVVEMNGVASDEQLDREQLAAIVAELERSELFDRDREYEAQGADLQRYEIRYAGSTVVAYDTSVPEPLQEAILLLEQAIRDERTPS
jgi:hypothetical protein